MIQCNSNFKYWISKISSEQCNICRSWSKLVSKVITRVYHCSFSYKLVYEIKSDAPIRGHHVYTQIWTPQKMTFKKDDHSEAVDMDKHAMGIYKEDWLVGHRFMTRDPMDCLSRGNLSWPKQNIFTKVNVMKVRNLFSEAATRGVSQKRCS